MPLKQDEDRSLDEIATKYKEEASAPSTVDFQIPGAPDRPRRDESFPSAADFQIPDLPGRPLHSEFSHSAADFQIPDLPDRPRRDESFPSAADFQIPDMPQRQRRSSLPTADEIRAYLASYARGEDGPAEPAPKPKEDDLGIDSRFLMGSNRPERSGTLRYGNREVDLSPEEDYRPPQSEDFIATHSPDKDEEAAAQEPLPKWKLFSRAKAKAEQIRVENAEKEEKRRAAKKVRYPEPKELVLPGEKPAPAAPARRAEPTPAAAAPAVAEPVEKKPAAAAPAPAKPVEKKPAAAAPAPAKPVEKKPAAAAPAPAKPVAAARTETVSEPTVVVNLASLRTKPEPTPEAVSEPVAEPAPVIRPASEAVPEPAPRRRAEPKHRAEAATGSVEPETGRRSEPKHRGEPKPESEQKRRTEPKHRAESKRKAEPKPAVPEPELELPEPETPKEKPSFTPSWTRAAAQSKEYASVFPDTSASPAIYADKAEEEQTPDETDASIPLKPDRFFPANVREYLVTLLTTAFYGMRRRADTIRTAEEDDEDLGPEAAPAFASRYYGRQTRSQRLRLQICSILLLFQGWVSLGLPVFGQLGNIRVAAFFCLSVQLTVMLLCQDVLTGGVLNAFRRRLGADSMAVIACLATSLDALLVGFGVLTAPHMPLCFLSSLSLTGVLLASLVSCRGLRKALRVPSIAKRAYTVTGEMSMQDHGTTILKSLRPYTGFVRRSEEAPPDESMFQKLSLPLLILVAFLTLLTLAFTRNVRDVFFVLSALLCAAVPFGALLCFALPFLTGSFRIFPSGAAIAGWSGLCDIGQSKNLIVTDRDLFPDGTVEIEQVRIFADARPERIISYAGSMLTACGSCVSKPFGDLMERNHCAMRQIENFEFLPGGGMRGVIDSSVILCGSSELMQLMNVRIPFRLVKRNSVLLAVDGVLYGIFNIQYTADPQVRKALIGLMRTTRHPIFAIRDFNVTPTMLSECFNVATDGYDFPPYVERFAISSAAPDEGSKVAAVVCRDGLGPLSDLANTGRSMYVAVRTSLYATVAGAVLGVLAAFFRMVITGGVSVAFLFLFMLFWLLPVLFFGFFLRIE